MSWRPQLNAVCGRCGKPRGLMHECAPKSDFRKRKAAHDREQRDRARKKRQQQAHDYTACSDNDCKRALCVAYKTGWQAGDEAGYDRGWQQGHAVGFKEGYAEGYPAGIADCPRDHK